MEHLKIVDVTLSLGNETVLDGLDLVLDFGERLVLVGPSGCGKTSLLRLIAGFSPPDKGTVLIEGRVVSRDGMIIEPPEERGIGFVFQDLALWPHMNVWQNLEFCLKARGVAKSERRGRINKILEMTDLIGLETRMPTSLSGGQQQRVALARALVAQPNLVLMDEPLSSLDWELRDRISKKIVSLQERLGFTLIYVTHDKEEIRRLATKVAIMEKGRLRIQD